MASEPIHSSKLWHRFASRVALSLYSGLLGFGWDISNQRLALRLKQRLGKTQQMQHKTSKAMPGLLAIIGLAGLAACSHPAPVAFVPPPPPPVGHTFQVMVQVPPPVRHIRITAMQQQELQQAFNVIALKSALMVGALTCNQQQQYDQFMTTFQPHILAEQHVMDAYFKRSSGYYGQTKEDTYVTLLANNQSVGGEQQGAVFCLNNSAEFKAVLALNTPGQLDNFVTDLSPDAPVVMAASPSVTPLSPGDSAANVAVVHSSSHSHLVAARTVHHTHYAVAQVKPEATPASAPAGTTVTASSAAPTKPISLAAAVPQ